MIQIRFLGGGFVAGLDLGRVRAEEFVELLTMPLPAERMTGHELSRARLAPPEDVLTPQAAAGPELRLQELPHAAETGLDVARLLGLARAHYNFVRFALRSAVVISST
jgi:hypothetical protein